MGKSTKRQDAPWKNTAGHREGMHEGGAKAPGRPGNSSRGHVHDAGFSYADFAKSNPRTSGQGKGGGKK